MVVYDHCPDFVSLETAVHHTDRVLLVDNGSRPDIRRSLAEFASRFPDRVTILENGTNLGLSKAYNRALAELKKLGIHWVYFLDHDAIFGAQLFEDTRSAWTHLEGQGSRMGVVAPIVTDDPLLANHDIGIRRTYSDLRTTLTSGIFTNLEVFNAVGGFDERLFVEAADLDLTSRIAQAGYRLCALNRVLIVQQFGMSPNPALATVRFGDRLIRFRSLVRVAIGNSNEYRTKLFYYPDNRHANHLRTLRWIIDQGYPWRNLVRLAYYLTILEHRYVARFTHPNGTTEAPTPRSEPTTSP